MDELPLALGGEDSNSYVVGGARLRGVAEHAFLSEEVLFLFREYNENEAETYDFAGERVGVVTFVLKDYECLIERAEEERPQEDEKPRMKKDPLLRYRQRVPRAEISIDHFILLATQKK